MNHQSHQHTQRNQRHATLGVNLRHNLEVPGHHPLPSGCQSNLRHNLKVPGHHSLPSGHQSNLRHNLEVPGHHP